jgi:hypothetical protein
MKFLWSVVGLGVLAWVPVAGAQDAPAKDAGYRDQNLVLAMVGRRVITKWEVMRSLEQKEGGFIKRFNERAQQLATLKKELKGAQLDGQNDEVARLKPLLVDRGKLMEASLSTLRGEQAKRVNDQLLIEQVKSDPLYGEPPGLVDYFLGRRVKANKDGLTGIIRDLQNDGRTMAMLRSEMLDNWILGRVNREMRQQVIVSPKQVRDRYLAQYVSRASQKYNVADLYLMRLNRDNTTAAALRQEAAQLAKAIRTRDDFMKISKELGAEGDGPQGLIPLNDGDSGTLDRDRKGSPLSGTPDIAALPTVERTGIIKDAHFKRLMVKVAGMTRGEADFFQPVGGNHVFVLYVNEVIRGYTIPLADQRKKIHADLFTEALREIRRRKLAEARKLVFVVDYLEAGEVSLLNLPADIKPPATEPPPVPPPKP